MDDASKGPIFLVGVGRSGTTMLRYMLCSHPGIYIPPDANFIPQFFRKRPTEPLARDRAIEIVGQLSSYKTFWRDWRDEPLDPDELVDSLPTLTPAAMLDGIYGRYARQHAAKRWGDKSTTYTSWIELIVRMFPTCQIIHIIRDGRDVTVSSLDAFRGARYLYMDPYYAARMWHNRLRAGITAGRRLPATQYLEIRYEELTSEPERLIRRVCGFLREDFDAAMLSPNEEAAKHYHSFGIYTLTNEEVTTVRQGRWRNDLAPADARIVQRVGGQLLQELGYPLEDLGSSSPGDRLRASALQMKFGGLDLVRRVLRLLGILNAGRLLHALPRGRRAEDGFIGSQLFGPPARRRTATGLAALEVAAVLTAIVAVVFLPGLNSRTASITLQGMQTFAISSRDHVTGRVVYAESPPAGGDHSARWVDCGAYDQPLRNEIAVHDLEHGAVWITHTPDLPLDQAHVLDSLAAETFVLVSPYPGLDTPIVATAWGRQIKLASATDPRLDQFIRAFRLGPDTPELGEPCTGGIQPTESGR